MTLYQQLIIHADNWPTIEMLFMQTPYYDILPLLLNHHLTSLLTLILIHIYPVANRTNVSMQEEVYTMIKKRSIVS